MAEWLPELLAIANETLTAAVVVITVSLLLYNLSRNLQNRVTRSASILLGCVTLTYALDVLLALEGEANGSLLLRRGQWLGIAFTPAALFHLADALLATTGLPSRGRRAILLRALYALSTFFAALALFSDSLVYDVDFVLRARPLFALFTLYFVLTSVLAFAIVERARRRCLTRDTWRRMAWLQLSLPTAPIALFPYSALLGPGEEFTLLALILVSTANATVILLLLFLSYPLSYFGSEKPDRVVKLELLRFTLRGPGMGLLALLIISFFDALPTVIGIQGEAFTPFAVVAGILLWQWMVHLALPWLGKQLIYDAEGAEQLERLDGLSDRLLARHDLLQLLEAVLATLCDSLRARGAAIFTLNDEESDCLASAGAATDEWPESKPTPFPQAVERQENELTHEITWLPLHSAYQHDESGRAIVIGTLGIFNREDQSPLSEAAALDLQILRQRAARALSDLCLQEEIFAVVEGLLPQVALTGAHAAAAGYPLRREGAGEVESGLLPERAQVIAQVRAALRHYWGGRGLYQSALQELSIVRARLTRSEYNPARALRDVLEAAIERQRPSGERQLNAPEWTLYNILVLRFIERRKVREVARQLALSEPDLYRKQRLAIEIVADTLISMENRAHAQMETSS